MSYEKVVTYKIIPRETFKMKRGCAGCGCKKVFTCKNRFRVNANGRNIDVWLIYGCETCSHTYNLPIYERVSPTKIPEQEYNKFLSNDEELVWQIGTDKNYFAKNKAEIVWELCQYEVVFVDGEKVDLGKERVLVKLDNSYNIPIRQDKVLADIFEVSRSRVKELLREGYVVVE